jgi:hypothetical protein
MHTHITPLPKRTIINKHLSNYSYYSEGHKSLKIPKGSSNTVNRSRTNNAIGNEKEQKEQKDK